MTHRDYQPIADSIQRNSWRRGPKVEDEAEKNGGRRVRVAPDADPLRRPVLCILPHGQATGPRRRPGPRGAGARRGQWHFPAATAAGISSSATAATVLPFSFSS
ncbi:uncharacterized protein J3R85_005989 [Psidium guajava]|nr:uncharacterized protein J3R85_005989 [Psidium guajava]